MTSSACESSLFIGLMSGTSMDGVDGVLADFSTQRPQVIAHAKFDFDAALRDALLALNTPGDNELHRCALAGNEIARLYAHVVKLLLADTGVQAAQVRAIGAHGQTVRHRPDLGYTSQLLNGALLAELCGIDVVCDLRSRDIAAGGQGAPLVPAFHQAMFSQPGQTVVVLNLGGIGNVSVLGADGSIGGFDCGPGNVLLDLWCHKHTGQAFDQAGQWAEQGQVHAGLLASLLGEPWLSLPPPKSTGRDLFHAQWLGSHLQAFGDLSAVDVQRTLVEFTARCATESVHRYTLNSTQASWLVCGGGAFNTTLMQSLQALVGGTVQTTAERGWPVMQVEAAAFAWLAHAHVHRRAGNLAAVTGARGLRVLGCLHPSGPDA